MRRKNKYPKMLLLWAKKVTGGDIGGVSTAAVATAATAFLEAGAASLVLRHLRPRTSWKPSS
jgi:hypothetical protein